MTYGRTTLAFLAFTFALVIATPNLRGQSSPSASVQDIISCYEYECYVGRSIEPRQLIALCSEMLVKYEKALDGPSRKRLLFARACASSALEDYAAALRDVKLQLEIDPADARAAILHAGLLALTGDEPKALAEYQPLLAKYPRDEHLLTSCAMVYDSHGDEAKALELATKAIETGSESSMAYWNRAAIYATQSQWKECLGDVNRSLEIAAFDRDVSFTAMRYRIRAKALFQLGKPEQAVCNLLLAANLDPKEANNYEGLFKVYATLRKPVQMQKAAQDLVKLQPKDYDSLFSLTEATIAMEEYEDALALTDKLLALDAKDPRARRARCLVFEITQDYGKAKQELDKALRDAPDDVECLGYMCGLLAACPDATFVDPKAALAVAVRLERANDKRDPSERVGQPEILCWKALAYAASRRFDDAHEVITKAIAHEASNSNLDWYKNVLQAVEAKNRYAFPVTLSLYRQSLVEKYSPRSGSRP